MARDGGRIGEQTSVATRVVVALVSVVTVLLAVLGAVHYASDRAAMDRRLRADAVREAEEVVPSLALALWNLDRQQVDRIIEGMMRVPDVYAVEVRQPDATAPGGETVYVRSRGPNWEMITPASVPAADAGTIVAERRIRSGATDVGSVRVLVSSKLARAALSRDLWAVAIRIVAVDVVLVLILWVSLRRTVINPLRVIDRYARDVSEGRRGETDLGAAPFHGELARLRDSIERMVRELDGRYAALESSRTFGDAVFESVPAFLAIYDRQGRLVRWNAAAEQMTGYTLEEFPRLGSAQPAADFDRVAAAIREVWENGQGTIEATVPCKHGARIPCYCRGVRMTIGGEPYMLVVAVDIRDRLRAEVMVLESEKMRTVAGLAAGMAHEINNPLAGMLQSAQVVLNRLRPELAANREAAERCGTTVESVEAYLRERGVPELLEAIRGSGRRAAEIVTNMLSFSRGSDVEPAAHDVGALLDAAVKFASDEYDAGAGAAGDFRHVRIRREYEPSLPPVRCRSTEIQQVVLNLLKNAAQAMAGRAGENGGAPTIVLRARRDGPGHVVVEVEDNGPGMPETVRRRAFEPFFTTKGPQSGSGLGLFVSYCIVTRNHGGTIAVDSTEGVGTKFTIRLPVGRGL